MRLAISMMSPVHADRTRKGLHMSFRTTLRLLLIACIFAAVPALAQPQRPQQDDPTADDIEQIVLRISWVNGDVSLQRGDEPGKWQPLAVNVPMTIGDRVYTGDGAKMELQSQNLRVFLAPNTELTALNLTEEVQQLSIAEG